MLMLSACGGGSDDDANAEVEGVTLTTATDTTVDESADGNAASVTTSPPGTSGSVDDISALNCPELVSWWSQAAAAMQTGPLGAGATTGFEVNEQFYQEIAAAAPAEIKSDMQVIADAFSAYVGALQDAGVNFEDPSSFMSMTPDQISQLEAAAESIDTPAVEQAGDNIQAFFERECS